MDTSQDKGGTHSSHQCPLNSIAACAWPTAITCMQPKAVMWPKVQVSYQHLSSISPVSYRYLFTNILHRVVCYFEKQIRFALACSRTVTLARGREKEKVPAQVERFVDKFDLDRSAAEKRFGCRRPRPRVCPKNISIARAACCTRRPRPGHSARCALHP